MLYSTIKHSMDIKPGIYRHYKGKLYQVLEVAKHSETLEEMIIYQALYSDHGFWVRPKKIFEEHVIDQGGNSIPRFALLVESQIEDEESEEGEEDDFELLNIYESLEEAEKIAQKIQEAEIDVQIAEIDANPEENKTKIFYQIWVPESHFAMASDVAMSS